MDGADEIQDDYRIQLEAALHAVEAAALEDPKTKPVIPGSFKPRARRWMRSPNLLAEIPDEPRDGCLAAQTRGDPVVSPKPLLGIFLLGIFPEAEA